jgi:hypothetical protein
MIICDPHSMCAAMTVVGDDVGDELLLTRKRRLRRIMPLVESRVLYLDHIRERGRDLFRVACGRDPKVSLESGAGARTRLTPVLRHG